MLNFVSTELYQEYNLKNKNKKKDYPTLNDFEIIKVLGTGGFS